MRFYEEITAVPEQARLSESTVYSLANKQFLAAALPAKFPRQAPRFPAALLAALEETVCDLATTLYFRIYGWWFLCSVGEFCGSLITAASVRQTPISTAKVLLGS